MDRSELERICELSKLKIEEEKFDGLLNDFNSILNYIEEIKNLDISQIEEEKTNEKKNLFREDVALESFNREKIEMVANNFQNSYFVVPKVIET